MKTRTPVLWTDALGLWCSLTTATIFAGAVPEISPALMELAFPGAVIASPTKDYTPLALNLARTWGNPNGIEVVFSAPVSEQTATNTSNYTVSPGVNVTRAVMGTNTSTVVLTTTAMPNGVTHTLTVNNVQDSATPPNTIATNTQAIVLKAQGVITRKLFAGLAGNWLNSLTNSPRFPASPDLTDYPAAFEAPSNIGDYYGDQMLGYIHPPVTGDYMFYLASDNEGLLYLSTDATVQNKVAIAYVPGDATGQRQWNKFASQHSGYIRLEAGRTYYVEALMGESTGNDWVAVTWRMRGMLAPADGSPALPGSFLSSITPSGPVVLLSSPQSQTILEGQTASFTAVPAGTPPYRFQWFRNGIAIPGATATNYVVANATLADNGGTFSVAVSNSFSGALSANATLTVNPDTRPLLLTRVSGSASMDKVRLAFSKPVNSLTANDASRYALSGGLSILDARLQPDQTNVVLTSSAQTAGQTYTITISGVTDTSGAHNSISISSNFVAWVLSRGFLHRDVFYNLNGSTVPDLVNSPRFPDNPDLSGEINTFETPSNFADYYGQRVFGYLLPPVTGYYFFYIASDDSSALYLSTDENPANRSQICYEPQNNPSRYWIGPDRRNSTAPENRSAPVYLQAGKRYYVEALMKEIYGGDNLGVTWQLPGAPAPVNGDPPIGSSYLFCYADPTAATLSIDQQPLSATIPESSSTNFTVSVSTSSSLVLYQWQKNGIDIPGATSSVYSTPRMLRADSGAAFKCLVSVPGASVTSGAAILTITPDTVAPQLVGAATLVGSTNISLSFNELMDPLALTNLANYTLSTGGAVTSAKARADGQSVVLGVSVLSFTNCAIRMSNLKDYAGNALPTTPVAVTAIPFESTDIGTPGDPAEIGSTFSSSPGNFDVVAGGSYIWNTADHGHFVYQQLEGDFDVQVRVARLDRSDHWSATGLMAREELSPGSRFSSVLTTPPAGANIYETDYRSATNGSAANWPGPNTSPGIPVPNAWLRFTRQGDTFTAYRGTNGVDWTQYAQFSQSLANRLLVGMITTANNNGVGQATTAWLRDFSINQGAPLPVPVDLAIKKSSDPDSAYVLTSLYQAYPSGAQVLALPARTNVPADFKVRVANNGPTTQNVVLRATESSEPGWAVTYLLGTNELSSLLRSASGWSTNLQAGQAAVLSLQMLPRYGVIGGTPKLSTITAATDIYTRSLRDAVQAVAINEIIYQPDMQVRRQSDVLYAGIGLFNTSGTNQTKSVTLDPGQTAVYPLRLVNTGNVTNYFNVTGGAAASGWSVRYFDALAGGADITSEITGTGAAVALLPGASWEFRAEVLADPGLLPLRTNTLLVTASSAVKPALSDTVRLMTSTPVITNTPQLIVFTNSAAWDQGVVMGTTPSANQLTLSGQPVTWPFIWVPNSNEGTVSKVDIHTGRELARYRTCPSGVNSQPSRTTIDQYGNCWVANRQSGTVIKIGLLETGGYYDRNTNGTIETSQDLNNDGDITGSELLPWGQDECVLYEVIVIPGREGTFRPGTYTGNYVNDYWNPGPRGIAVDYLGNVWVGTHDSMKMYYLDGFTAALLLTNDLAPLNHTSYGAVIDGNGVLWSSGYKESGQNNILRLNTLDNTMSTINFEFHTYGLGLDRSNHLFVSGHQEAKLSRLNVLTGVRDWTVNAGYQSRGIAVTDDGDVWVACSSEGTVWRFSNDGVFKNKIYVGNTPTGVSVDSDGKVWVVNDGDENIQRIDPAIGLYGDIDLTKRIIGGVHYGYSDMTGIISRTATGRFGTWTFVHNALVEYAQWGKLTWTGYEPSNNNIRIRVRSSNSPVSGLVAWSDWETATNGMPLVNTPPGKYLQVEITLRALPSEPSPYLSNLTIEPLAQRTADLAIAQTVLPTVATNDHPISWSFAITNSGPQDARGVFIHQQLPPGVQVVAVSNSIGTIQSFVSGSQTSAVRCVIGSLPVGSNAFMKVDALVTAAGTLTNVVSVGHFENDPSPLNNTNTLLTIALPNPCLPPPEGIFGWWAGENNAADAAGTNAGTLINGVSFSPGKVGQAFVFNGNNSYVDLGRVSPGTTWSLEAWVKPNVVQNGRIAVMGCHADCRDWSLLLNNGELGVNVGYGGCVRIVGSGVVVSPGVWYHVVGTCDGASGTIYVNGQLKNSAAVDANYVGSSSGFRIGGSVCCGEYYAGMVDEPTLYKRALSPTEVFALFDAARSGKCRTEPPLLAIASASANLCTVSWPTNAVGFNLQAASAVTGSWQLWPISPTPVGDQNVVYVGTSNAVQMFRLIK